MAATHSLSLVRTSSQYASIADASCPNLEISGSQTFMCWINFTSFADYEILLAKANGANVHDMYIGAAAKPVFRLAGLTTNTSVTANTALATGVWVHVTGVYDSTATKLLLYLNGELDNSVTASGSAVDTNGNFYIGANDAGTYLNGKIRNVRIYASALTQAQIRSEMNVDTPAIATVGDWPLNNAYTDNSGNGYTLTASGSPTFSTTYPDAIDLVENGTYLKKHKITIDNTKVSGSSDLTDVPIVLTESNFLADAFSNSLNGGADIRFSTDEDGKIRLAHEIVTWNTGTSVAEVHVKVNTLSYNTDTDIYVHYNNSSATAIDENEAFGKHQVWGENWEGVWHGNNSTDSSKNSNDGTDTAITRTTGKIGNAPSFNGTTSLISAGTGSSLNITGDMTIIGYIYPNSLGEASGGRIFERSDGSGGHLFNVGTNNVLNFSPVSGTTIATDANAITLSAWNHIAFRRTSTTGDFYVNGSNVKTGTTSASTTASTTAYIGNNSAATRTFDGIIDELMIYSGSLSDDYITTIYNNQNSPSTFATASAVGNTSAFFMFL